MKRIKVLVFLVLLMFASGLTATALAGSDSASVPDNRIPWSGYWWPLSLGQLVTGYLEQPSPLKKYDAYATGYYPARATRAGMNVEYDPDASAWFGHCDDWAAASILEAEPDHAGDLNGIPFNVGDKKGLLTLFVDDNFTTVRYGSRYLNSSSDIDDIHPGGVDGFHQTLINYIGIQGLPIVIDVDPQEAIWSYPAYRYEMEWEDSGTIRHVTCTVWMADDFVDPDYVGTRAYTETYTYALQTDGQGNVLDAPGYWEGDSVDNHPDFMWFPTTSSSTHAYLDRTVLDEIIACEENGSDDRFEENDAVDSAHAIPERIEDRYYWGSAQDADWYRVAAHKGDDFYAFILSLSDDIDVRIFDETGNETGYAFYHGARINTVEESAYYYVRVLSDTLDGAYYNIEFFSSPTVAIPHITAVNGWDTALTMVGEEWYFDQSRINLFEGDTALLEQDSLTVPENEITLVSFGERFAAIVDEAATARVLYLDAARTAPGFFSYANDHQLANLPLGVTANTRLIVPDVRHSGHWGTGVAIQNMDAVEQAQVTLSVYDSSGNLAAENSFVLGAEENRAELIPGFGDIPATASWVQFTSDKPLQGFVLYAVANGGSANGLAGIPLLREQHFGETLYLPHLAASSVWDTDVALVNPNAVAAAVTITGYDSQGNIAATRSLQLAANGNWTGSAADLFGTQWQTGIVWARMEADEAICGYQLYRRGGEALAALPLVNADEEATVLNVKSIPDNASSWTGLILLNPGDRKSDIWAEPLDASGNNLLGEDYLWYNPPDGIPAHANAVGVVEQLFPGFPEDTVRLRIYSDEPIVGFGLYELIDAGQVDVLYLD